MIFQSCPGKRDREEFNGKMTTWPRIIWVNTSSHFFPRLLQLATANFPLLYFSLSSGQSSLLLSLMDNVPLTLRVTLALLSSEALIFFFWLIHIFSYPSKALKQSTYSTKDSYGTHHVLQTHESGSKMGNNK